MIVDLKSASRAPDGGVSVQEGTSYAIVLLTGRVAWGRWWVG